MSLVPPSSTSSGGGPSVVLKKSPITCRCEACWAGLKAAQDIAGNVLVFYSGNGLAGS